MVNEKVLHFIAKKIEDINAAILYCHSNSPLKIHNTIIRTLNVDENGNIFFFIKRPGQLISHFEQEFPVGLNYFKKGKSCFFNIFGKARIINDPEELAYQPSLTYDEINSALTTHILIKVKILKVDFFDNNYEKKNMIFKKVVSVFSKLFDYAGATSRSYNLSPDSSLHNYGF